MLILKIGDENSLSSSHADSLNETLALTKLTNLRHFLYSARKEGFEQLV